MQDLNDQDTTRPPMTAFSAQCSPTEFDERLNELIAVMRGLDTKLDAIHGQINGQLKPLYSVGEIADMVDRSAYTVRRWISEGLIDAIRVSGTGPKGRLLIPRGELKKLVELGLGETIPSVVVN